MLEPWYYQYQIRNTTSSYPCQKRLSRDDFLRTSVVGHVERILNPPARGDIGGEVKNGRQEAKRLAHHLRMGRDVACDMRSSQDGPQATSKSIVWCPASTSVFSGVVRGDNLLPGTHSRSPGRGLVEHRTVVLLPLMRDGHGTSAISPPARVLNARKVTNEIVSDRNWTEPSPMAKLAPPGWLLP